MFKHIKRERKTHLALVMLLIILVMLLTQLTACQVGERYVKAPTSKKIDISQANLQTEMLVRINTEDNYAFSLKFKFHNKEESVRLLKLLKYKDSEGRDNGEKTPISIDVYTIKDGENVLVALGGGESMPVTSFGSSFNKQVFTSYLFPGDYRVLIDTKSGNPKFKNVDVEVSVALAHRPK